jgi:hypothetical protein
VNGQLIGIDMRLTGSDSVAGRDTGISLIARPAPLSRWTTPKGLGGILFATSP